jgi:hypothetical protein
MEASSHKNLAAPPPATEKISSIKKATLDRSDWGSKGDARDLAAGA